MYLIFEDTRSTLFAEDLLIERGLEARTLGKPPDWEGGCGLALRVSAGDLERARGILESGGLHPLKAAPPPKRPGKQRLI